MDDSTVVNFNMLEENQEQFIVNKDAGRTINGGGGDFMFTDCKNNRKKLVRHNAHNMNICPPPPIIVLEAPVINNGENVLWLKIFSCCNLSTFHPERLRTGSRRLVTITILNQRTFTINSD